MKTTFIQGLTAVLCVAMAGPVGAEVYKWVDSAGRVSYSDRPQNREAEVLNIKSKPTDKAAIAAQLQARLDAKHAAAADAQAQSEADAQESERQALRDENCRRAQQALASVLGARRLYVPDEDGNRRYLNDDETAQRRLDAQKDVDEWCGLN